MASTSVGDLTQARDVAGALSGCRRRYFGMSVSPSYSEATVTTAAVARERSDLEVFNFSQVTVFADEPYRDDGLSPSGSSGFANKCSTGPGLPVVNVRPRFLSSIPFSRNGPRNRLPGTRRFGCRLGPDAPRRSTREMWLRSLHQFWSVQPMLSKVYELTGPRSQNMHGVAAEYSEALGPAYRVR
jgi:NAD(P)H dehydrogenase (quinone)